MEEMCYKETLKCKTTKTAKRSEENRKLCYAV